MYNRYVYPVQIYDDLIIVKGFIDNIIDKYECYDFVLDFGTNISTSKIPFWNFLM